ncbi:MAG: FAD-dependent oxidoreductase [Nitrospira sp.]|nr:FAD-dependent oxidoreductase [Nitrospira sp.]
MDSRLLIFVTIRPPQTVVIVGAGLTGLATALFLSEQGRFDITLIDLVSDAEGYATNAHDPVPIILGRHRETLRLLRLIQPPPTSGVSSFVLEFRLASRQTVSYRPLPLPGSWQWIVGLLRFRGLTWQERWTLLSYLEQLWEGALSFPSDLDNHTADQWLASIGQSQASRRQIWNPLSRWLTGNHLECLSASVFVHQLTEIFLQQARDVSLCSLHGSIGDRFLTPLRQALERKGIIPLRYAERPFLQLGPNGIEAIRLSDGRRLQARWYITALSHRELLALLPEQLLARYAYFARLIDLKPLPEATVEFRLGLVPPCPRLVLLPDHLFHQAIITPSGSNQMTCRLSIAAPPPLEELSDDHLLQAARAELQQLYSHNLPIETSTGTVHRHEQAALSLHPGVTLRRPLQQSPLPNLLLAGPWTDTGWPANVESAIVSARRCTDIVHRQSTA